jgi:hypothetical protein
MTDRPREDERRAAEIIIKCVQVGLWDEARSLYDCVAADGTGALGSGACSSLSLAHIQKEALALLGSWMSGTKMSAAAGSLRDYSGS